jgi:hypothetical protein
MHSHACSCKPLQVMIGTPPAKGTPPPGFLAQSSLGGRCYGSFPPPCPSPDEPPSIARNARSRTDFSSFPPRGLAWGGIDRARPSTLAGHGTDGGEGIYGISTSIDDLPLLAPGGGRSEGGGHVGEDKPGGRGRKGNPPARRCTWTWNWWLAVCCIVLASCVGCSVTRGRVIGQQFVSPIYAFEVSLPGNDWRTTADGPAVLTLTHMRLAAGITISVTCDREHQAPLDVLARHLFFGFKDMEILQQGPRALNGVQALQTVAQARLDGRAVQVNSYVAQRDRCVYDIVYVASPEDYARGEPSFERMLAGFRFLPR